MSKNFAFTFYVNDWLGGTMYLTFEQKGAYLELLLLQFNQGRFTLRQAQQVLNTSFTTCWEAIADKFTEEEGLFFNARMEEVKESRERFVESRRNNRLGKVAPPKAPPVKPDHKNKTSNTLDKHKEREREKERAKEGGDENLPPLERAFNEFVKMRKAKKKEPTPRAIELIKNKLRDMSNNNEEIAIALLNQSIVNNWIDIYPLKTTDTNANNQQPTSKTRNNAANNLLDLSTRAADAQTLLAG